MSKLDCDTPTTRLARIERLELVAAQLEIDQAAQTLAAYVQKIHTRRMDKIKVRMRARDRKRGRT